jgi:hypothetical protein
MTTAAKGMLPRWPWQRWRRIAGLLLSETGWLVAYRTVPEEVLQRLTAL